MNEMIITLKSGISADGFKIEIPGKFKKDFAYGYDVSSSREEAENAHKDVELAKKNNWSNSWRYKEKPYVSDLIKSLMNEYDIDPEDVNVKVGENTFKGSNISIDKVKEFEKDYLAEIF